MTNWIGQGRKEHHKQENIVDIGGSKCRDAYCYQTDDIYHGLQIPNECNDLIIS
jgi:hypothetical protein